MGGRKCNSRALIDEQVINRRIHHSVTRIAVRLVLSRAELFAGGLRVEGIDTLHTSHRLAI